VIERARDDARQVVLRRDPTQARAEPRELARTEQFITA
jgi:hypothetical protein